MTFPMTIMLLKSTTWFSLWTTENKKWANYPRSPLYTHFCLRNFLQEYIWLDSDFFLYKLCVAKIAKTFFLYHKAAISYIPRVVTPSAVKSQPRGARNGLNFFSRKMWFKKINKYVIRISSTSSIEWWILKKYDFPINIPHSILC